MTGTAPPSVIYHLSSVAIQMPAPGCQNMPEDRPGRMVGLGRFERPTSRLSGVRSDQLSYRPRSDRPQATPAPRPAPSDI